MSNSRWKDDSIQFPRLIAEIIATQEKLDIAVLCASMDITVDELDELFERAQNAWARISYDTRKPQ
jgi:hypothetical protein